jgi:hypothetical protein
MRVTWPAQLAQFHGSQRGQEYQLWAELGELPGCFASDRDTHELAGAPSEVVSPTCLSQAKRSAST